MVSRLYYGRVDEKSCVLSKILVLITIVEGGKLSSAKKKPPVRQPRLKKFNFPRAPRRRIYRQKKSDDSAWLYSYSAQASIGSTSYTFHCPTVYSTRSSPAGVEAFYGEIYPRKNFVPSSSALMNFLYIEIHRARAQSERERTIKFASFTIISLQRLTRGAGCFVVMIKSRCTWRLAYY